MTNEQAYEKAIEQTDQNDHQGAVLTLAEHFGVNGVAAAVRGVIAIQEARGFMDPQMIDMMHVLRSDLFTAIEQHHGWDARRRASRCL